VALKISVRRGSDKPVKNLSTKTENVTTLQENRQRERERERERERGREREREREERERDREGTNVMNDDLFWPVCSACQYSSLPQI
jgi:hypothetical protein